MLKPERITLREPTANLQLIGKRFHITLVPGVSQERGVRVMEFLDPVQGGTVFYPVRNTVRITPSDYRKLPVSQADKTYDKGKVIGPDLPTVLKHGASTAGTDTDEEIRKNGGSPKHRMDKSGGRVCIESGKRKMLPESGFAVSTSADEVRFERQRKKLGGSVY
jgi:hypothetical protein